MYNRLLMRDASAGRIECSANCVVTGEPYAVTVSTAGLLAYRGGALMQTAFPELPTDEREFLISGTSPDGWEKLFPNGCITADLSMCEAHYVDYDAS